MSHSLTNAVLCNIAWEEGVRAGNSSPGTGAIGMVNCRAALGILGQVYTCTGCIV